MVSRARQSDLAQVRIALGPETGTRLVACVCRCLHTRDWETMSAAFYSPRAAMIIGMGASRATAEDVKYKRRGGT